MTSTSPVSLRPTAPRFLCDAMLGGLARWLRAAGYDAAFEPRIDDGVLVARAAATGELLLSSDQPLFDRKLLRTGHVRGLFVPRHAPILEQVVFVLGTLDLEVREARCMACGGALETVDRNAVAGRVPPRALAAFDVYFRCQRCIRVYWHGTHWVCIQARRDEIGARLRTGHADEPSVHLQSVRPQSAPLEKAAPSRGTPRAPRSR